MNTRMICRFATAYSAYCDATIKGDENSRLVWLDLYVEAADELGIPDSEHHGLADCRAEKKMRDEEFLERFRASRVDAASTTR